MEAKCIPSLLHNNEFKLNFRDKAGLFNNFLGKQCAMIDNAGAIPAILIIKIPNSFINPSYKKLYCQNNKRP